MKNPFSLFGGRKRPPSIRSCSRWVAALFAVAMPTGCLQPNPLLDSGDSDMTDASTMGSTSIPATTATTQMTDGGPTSGGTDSVADATTAEGPADTGSETEGCEVGVCTPSPPREWQGPVVVADLESTNDRVSCPTEFPLEVFVLHENLDAPEAECICECGPASGASCSDIVLELHGGDDTCVGGANEEFDIGSSCQEGPAVSSNSRFWSVDQPGLEGGSCNANESTNVPDVTWSTTSLVCGAGPDRFETCDNEGICVPTAAAHFEANVCVWQAGLEECPATGFSRRVVRFSEFTDERGCSDCSCDPPEGDCVGNVRLWPSDDCSGGVAAGSIPIGGGCIASVDSVSSADRGSLSVTNVSCEPQGGTPTGEATPAEPYTFCCLPK